jgi:hypothetical protein
MLVVAVVILAGVVAVASGRGGEMAVPEPDYPPIDLGPVSAADVALLRPPSAAWGYNMRVTDEALDVIARAVTERDVQIAALQQQVSDLRERLGGGAWPTEAGSLPPESAAATGDLEDTVPPAYPEPSDYLEYPDYPEPSEYQSELDDPLAPAGPADPEATAEPGVTEHGVTEPGVTEDATAPDAQPAPEPIPEPAWPGEDGPQAPGPGPGPAVPPVAITRPQPIYRRPADHDDDPKGPGAADTAWDQPTVRSGPSAPWGPAQPPGQWHQPEQASAPEVLGPPESPADPVMPPGPEVPPGPETPIAPDDHGWGTDPADTSPDAKPLDWTAAPPAAGAEPTPPSAPPPAPLSAPPPAQPPAEPEPTDWDGRSQPSPAPSVWDVASRQVDEAQARPAPSAPGHHAEFIWDEDPHQTVVWGAEHARAKAARTADETLPNAEQRDDERG